MRGDRYADLLAGIDLPQKSRRGTFEAILAVVDSLPRGRVLDCPCGPGRLSAALQRLGFDVIAADIDAAAFAAGAGIPFVQADLDRPLPFRAEVLDGIVCSDGIEHVENPFALFREFARVLRPEASLLVATPNYSCMERRVRFLISGALTKPVRRRPHFYRGAKTDRGHINPLTLPRLAYAAENAGLRLEEADTAVRKPKRLLMAPVAAAAIAVCRIAHRTRLADMFAPEALSLRVVLGGRKLVVRFRKAES